MNKYKIPFNKPNFDPKALIYMNDAVAGGHITGDGK